jgi:uncharacterized membrane protein/thiol-disulfide isomerase/thioredoxin
MKKQQNIFVSFLSLLKVKHTKDFSNKYFGEHPYKYSLYGISKMLCSYGIANAGIKVENKEEIFVLDVPFIAHINNDFVIVTKITSNKISYIWRDLNITISSDEFYRIWDGIILVAEPDEDSIEPNYKENRKKFFVSRGEKIIFSFIILFFIITDYFQNRFYADWEFILFLIPNIIGIYISYLLLLKQMHIQSNYSDKICSLFKKSNCNDILESPAAKFMGIIGWSEIGLGYFISNFLLLIFYPHLFLYYALINICALPYSFWSVWYQKFKAKQWCTLCLIVQVLFWTIFIFNLLFGGIKVPSFFFSDIMIVVCLYFIPVLFINIILPQLIDSRKIEGIMYESNSMRMRNEVFLSYLKQQPYYKVDKHTSNILFGNYDAPLLVTILTNPHCNPCAKMHQRIQYLLEETGNKFCVQYIFSSFYKELDSSGKFLIAAYFEKTRVDIHKIYDHWFSEGRYHREVFFKSNNIHIESLRTDNEYVSHQKWIEDMHLRETPTVLINGYKLPENYKVEDMKFFTDLNIEYPLR